MFYVVYVMTMKYNRKEEKKLIQSFNLFKVIYRKERPPETHIQSDVIYSFFSMLLYCCNKEIYNK